MSHRHPRAPVFAALLATLFVMPGLASCSSAPSVEAAPTAAPAPAPAPAPAAPAPVAPAEATPAAPADPAAYGLVGTDYSCGPCMPAGSLIKSVRASSTLENKASYAASNAFDGKLDTAWCEGVAGPGVGQTLTVEFTQDVAVDGAFVHGGYFKSEAALSKNTRLRELAVRIGDETRTELLADPAQALPPPDYWSKSWWEATLAAGALVGGSWPQTLVREVQFEVKAAWPGSAYEDLCISEIDLMVIDPAEL